MNSRQRKAPGAGELTGRELIASRDYHALDLVQASNVWAVWQHEATRLASEYLRKGRESDRLAFERHMGGMLFRVKQAIQ